MGTFVQANRGYETGSDNSFAVAYTSNITADNLLVVTVGAYHATATINTPTDIRGTTYTQAGTLLRAPSGVPLAMLGVYYGIAPGSGANTVTVGFSVAVTDKEIKVFEVSGIDTTTPLNQTQSTTGTGITIAFTPNITTTIPGWILKVLQEYEWTTHNEASGTPTTGWTEFGDTATGSDSAYRNEVATGTFNGGFTMGSGSPHCLRIVAFADGSAPAGQPISKRWGGVTYMNTHRGAGKRW